MTDAERSLLLHVARWIIAHEEAIAEGMGETSNNLADDMRALIDVIHDNNAKN